MNSSVFSPAGWIWYSRPLLAVIMVIFAIYTSAQGKGTVMTIVLGVVGFILLALNIFLIAAHKKLGRQFPWQRKSNEDADQGQGPSRQ